MKLPFNFEVVEIIYNIEDSTIEFHVKIGEIELDSPLKIKLDDSDYEVTIIKLFQEIFETYVDEVFVGEKNGININFNPLDNLFKPKPINNV